MESTKAQEWTTSVTKKEEKLNCTMQIFCMAVISTKNQSVPNIPTIVIASMGEAVISFGGHLYYYKISKSCGTLQFMVETTINIFPVC